MKKLLSVNFSTLLINDSLFHYFDRARATETYFLSKQPNQEDWRDNARAYAKSLNLAMQEEDLCDVRSFFLLLEKNDKIQGMTVSDITYGPELPPDSIALCRDNEPLLIFWEEVS